MAERQVEACDFARAPGAAYATRIEVERYAAHSEDYVRIAAYTVYDGDPLNPGSRSIAIPASAIEWLVAQLNQKAQSDG